MHGFGFWPSFLISNSFLRVLLDVCTQSNSFSLFPFKVGEMHVIITVIFFVILVIIHYIVSSFCHIHPSFPLIEKLRKSNIESPTPNCSWQIKEFSVKEKDFSFQTHSTLLASTRKLDVSRKEIFETWISIIQQLSCTVSLQDVLTRKKKKIRQWWVKSCFQISTKLEQR